ncbi:MAG TPA: tetratricopeptide repeat protein [Gammaproteobacteria bacterium]
MNIHHSEEEQIESLKKWWRENGLSVLFGIVVGLAGLFGWHLWQEYKARHATEASTLYSDLMSKLSGADAAAIDKAATSLRTEYDDTVYAALGALAMAKAAVDRNDTDGAIEQLQWAIDHTPQTEIAITAKLRLSRLYLTQGKFDRVEALLNESYPKAYAAAVDELKGDLLVAKGDPKTARQAYERALTAEIAPYSREVIQHKLDQLAPSESTDA